MNTRPRRLLITTASLAAMLVMSACSDKPMNQGPVMVPFGTLPAAAQHTFANELGSQLPDTVQQGSVDGMIVYEAKVAGSNGSREIVRVDYGGKLLTMKTKGPEVKVAWNKVPKAVRRTVLKNNHGMQPDKVEKEKVNGKTVYEAVSCTKDGMKHIVKVSKSGKLLSVTDKE